MRKAFLWIRSVAFVVTFYTLTAVWFIVTLPVLFLPIRVAYVVPWVWTRMMLVLIRAFCGVKLEVRGLENLPAKNGYIIASKHQSAFETLIFHQLLPNVFFVFKRELMWIPIAGLVALRTACVPIDRGGGGATMRKMLAHVERNLKAGRNLVIFPEGTRTKPGVKQPYSPGVALLYDQCHVPVVPVALNSGYIWPKNSTLKYPGTVTVEFLKPIEPGLHKRAFLSELYDRIEECQERLPNPLEKTHA